MMREALPAELRILLVSLSNLGDAILTLPVLDCLKASYPDARIDVVAGSPSRVVFEDDPRVEKVFVYEKRESLWAHFRFAMALKREGYAFVVDLRRSYFGLLGRRPNLSFLMPRRGHRIQSHLSVLHRLGIGAVPQEFRSTPASANPPAERTQARLVVMAPAAKSDTKRWPGERYGVLADRLIQSEGVEVTWIGSSEDSSLIREIRSRMVSHSVDLAGKLSWAETAQLIARAALVVTNDSAPLHQADRLGRKTLVFFGPTDPEKYGPRIHPEGLLFKHRFCSPCEKAQCRYHLECLREISVEEALKRARRLLNGEGLMGPRILVIRLDRMGDLVLSYPAMAAIRKTYPSSRLTLLSKALGRELGERFPDVDEVIPYDYEKGKGSHRFPWGYGRLLKELRRRKFDLAFILHPSLRSHLLAFLAGIPHRIGYHGTGSSLLTVTIPDTRREGYQHESQYALDVVRAFPPAADPREAGGDARRAFGVEPSLVRPSLEVYGEDLKDAESLLTSLGFSSSAYFCIHAGSRSPSKQWGRERFSDLVKLAGEKWSLPAVMVGAEEDREISDEILTRAGGSGLNLAGKTSPRLLAAILRKSRFLVANDAGPSHVASAVGTPVVSIFGRKEPGLGPRRWRPLGPHAAFVHEDPGCAVCLADACPINFECLKLLGPERVMVALEGVLR